MASEQMQRPRGPKTSQNSGEQGRQEAVKSATSKIDAISIYSQIAELGESTRFLGQNLMRSDGMHVPDFITKERLDPDFFKLDPTDENYAYASHQNLLLQLSVDNDRTFSIENFSIQVSGDVDEYHRKYEHIEGPKLLSSGSFQSKDLKIDDIDNYNNRDIYPGVTSGMVLNNYINMRTESGLIGTKFVSAEVETPTVFIDTDTVNLHTDLANRQGKSFITNVPGGPIEISAQTAEIRLYYDNTPEAMDGLRSFCKMNNQEFGELNRQFANLSAYEAKQLATMVVREIYGDTAMFENGSIKYVNESGYIREVPTHEMEMVQKAFKDVQREYIASKELVISSMKETNTYREPDYTNPMSVKQNKEYITTLVMNGQDFQQRISNTMGELSTEMSRSREAELTRAIESNSPAITPLELSKEYAMKERKKQEESKQTYLLTLKELRELDILPIEDKAGNVVRDKNEVLRELGISNPDRLDTMSPEELEIQYNNVASRAMIAVPTDEKGTQGLNQHLTDNKVQNIEAVLDILARLQANHPDAYSVDVKNLFEHGNHDRLPVDAQFYDSFQAIRDKCNVKVVTDITHDTLASREACEAARAAIHQYIDRELRVAYHEGTLTTSLTSYQSLVDSIKVKELFASAVDADGKKLDISAITPEAIAEASRTFYGGLNENNRNVLQTAIQLKVLEEMLERHEHSQDYKFSKELTSMITDEDNKTLVLKYAAEHYEDLRKLKVGVSEEIYLDRVEKHLSVYCNIPTDEMVRLRTSPEYGDFLRSDIFRSVSSYGVPEGVTFKSFSESCGIKSMEDLQNPANLTRIIDRLDAEIKELKSAQLEGNRGAQGFVDDGRLTVYQDIRLEIANYILTNNLELARQSEIKFEYDEKILQKITYTHEEERILSQHKEALTADGKGFDHKFENPYEAQQLLTRLKAEVTEENPEANAELIKILESKFAPVAQYADSYDRQEAIVFKPSAEQETAIQSQYDIIREKEEFIRFAINFDKDANFSEMYDKFCEQYPDSWIAQLPDSEFVQEAEKISWRDFEPDSYKSFGKFVGTVTEIEEKSKDSADQTEIREEFSVKGMSPTMLEAQKGAYAHAMSEQVAALIQPEMDEITRLAGKSVEQYTFRANMLQLAKDNPFLDVKDFEQIQQTLANQKMARAFSDMLAHGEDGKVEGWNLSERVDLRSYEPISTKDIVKAREEVKEEVSQEVRTILKGSPSFEECQEQLRSVGADKFGSKSMHEMLENQTSAAKTAYEIDKELVNIQYSKLPDVIVKQNEMAQDIEKLKAIQERMAELEREKAEASAAAPEKQSFWQRIRNYQKSLDTETPTTSAKENNEKINEVNQELARLQTKASNIAGRYDITIDSEHSVSKAVEKLEEMHKESLDHGKQLEQLQSKYAKAIESIHSETSEDLTALKTKPLASWTEEDKSTFLASQPKTNMLAYSAMVKTLDKDIETAQAHTECQALSQMKTMIESTIEARNPLNAHEVEQVTSRVIGRAMEIPEADQQLQNLRTSAQSAEADYQGLRELRQHVQDSILHTGATHSTEMLSEIGRLYESHAAYERAVDSYNQRLDSITSVINADGKTGSIELPVMIAETEVKTQVEAQVYGKSEVGVVLEQGKPMQTEQFPESITDFMVQNGYAKVELVNGHEQIHMTDKFESIVKDSEPAITGDVYKEGTVELKLEEKDKVEKSTEVEAEDAHEASNSDAKKEAQDEEENENKYENENEEYTNG